MEGSDWLSKRGAGRGEHQIGRGSKYFVVVEYRGRHSFTLTLACLHTEPIHYVR